MPTYTFIPNQPNPDKVNAMLGSSKVTEIQTMFPYGTVTIKTDTALLTTELDAIRAKLNKIFIFGYSESVDLLS